MAASADERQRGLFFSLTRFGDEIFRLITALGAAR